MRGATAIDETQGNIGFSVALLFYTILFFVCATPGHLQPVIGYNQ